MNVFKKIVLSLIIVFSFSCYAFAFSIQDTNTIIDDGNRKIKVIKPFNRIISLYPAHTENICSLGSSNKLIGISKSDTYPPYILNKRRFSYHFGIERFLSVQPDLVLIRPMIDKAYPELIKHLEKENIKIISIQPNSVQSMFDYWKILGIIVRKQERSIQMIHDFKNMLNLFKNINSKIYKKKKVYFESIHRKVKTFAKHSIPIFVLETAGGVNVAKDAVEVGNTNIADYGKERLLSKANIIDVFISQYGRMNRIRIQDIKNEPGFNTIEAVKQNRIYLVDEELTSRPTIRLLLGIYEIGHILYPEYYNKQLKEKIMKVIKKYS